MTDTEHRIVDEFGRATVFTGHHLYGTSTDDGSRPRWACVDVWRTTAGRYVVLLETSWRIRHLNQKCSRAEGYELAPADEEDTHPCPECNPDGAYSPGWAQQSRTSIEVYPDAQALVDGFPSPSRFNRYVLSQLAAVDPDINAVWKEVLIP